MKATVDQEKCIGCGLCVETCPEVFQLEDDKAKVMVDVVPKVVEDACKDAADGCPVTAISISRSLIP